MGTIIRSCKRYYTGGERRLCSLFHVLTIALAIQFVNSQNVFLRSTQKQVLDESCTAVLMENGNSSPELLCATQRDMFFRIPGIPAAWITEKIRSRELISGKTQLDIPIGTVIEADSQTLHLDSPPRLVNKKRDLMATGTPPVVGKRTVLVVRVKTTDGETSRSEAEISNYVFGDNGDEVNLRSQYLACSFGKLEFVKAENRNGIFGASIRNGVTSVSVPVSSSVGTFNLIDSITSQLASQFSTSDNTMISMRELSNHLMYVLPQNAADRVGGALINWHFSFYDNDWIMSSSVQMHEIAHNLGAWHNFEDGEEYGDETGLMGNSYQETDSRICFSAPKSWQFGWYRDKSATFVPGRDGVQWSGRLGSIVDYETSDNTVLIQIEQTEADVDFYIGFNAATGMHADVREARNFVVVYEAAADGFSKTTSEAQLAAGQAYTIENFNGRNGDTIRVTVGNIDLETHVADIDITSYLAQSTSSVPSSSPTTGLACQTYYQSCIVDTDCCHGLTCRKVSVNPDDPSICRPVLKHSKDKLGRRRDFCVNGVGPRCNQGPDQNKRRLRGDSSFVLRD